MDADGAVSAEDLRTCLAVSFAKFEIPDQFVFVDELPKTSVGKFDKKVLRSCHAEGAL